MKPSSLITAVVAVSLAAASASHACVGTACMEIWSTADGGGALTVQWDFDVKVVQTYASFCAPDNSLCLYTTIDPGFMAPTDDVPGDAYYRLVDGTAVRVQLVSTDAGLSLNVNGQKLDQPGESALLGTMPTIHNHPSWQIVAPGDQLGNYHLSYMLTTDSALYTASQVYTVTVTNIPPPDDTPTPTALTTPTPTPGCPGDCNNNGTVNVNELVVGMDMAASATGINECPSLDTNHDGMVSVDEILTALTMALAGCPTPPPATLDEIQRTIFTPSCAIPTCHDAQSAVGNLVLTADRSYDELVNVAPDIQSARDAGLLRVDPGAPDNSFLLIKLEGPPLSQGSRMPLTGALLTPEQVQLIRDWILQGATQ